MKHVAFAFTIVAVAVGCAAGAFGGPGPSWPPSAAAVSGRALSFNGKPLDRRGLETVAHLERAVGQRLPDGAYWYDPVSGAAGMWGGPTRAVLPAGLHLGGPVPANASGGGKGRVTGVFVNGRELHRAEVTGLTGLLGQAPRPGRYWLDARGNVGLEGGPALVNLLQVARQRGQRGWHHSTWTPGGRLYGGSDGSSHYFFDSASGCSVMNDGGGVQC